VAAVLLGLTIAAAFGSGDFVGGRASRNAASAAVLVVAGVCSVAGAFIVAVVVAADVAPHDVIYGTLAGVVNFTGLAVLYHALAKHAAGVVAPITAVVGALVPVTWGLAHGERPSALVWAGIALAIAAGALIAREPGPANARSWARGAAEAVVAGAALGMSLVLYSETSEASGQWPIFAARLSALVCAVVAVGWLARQGAVQFPQGSARGLAVAAGILDVAASVLLLVAVRRDLLVIVAPIVSLAPAFTVVLAWWITGEHLHRAQRLGFLVALVGLVLVAAG
jgi:drug/metabolite transporter (DMT)-like permease